MQEIDKSKLSSSSIIISTILILLLIITVGGATTEIMIRQRLLMSIELAVFNNSSNALDQILLSGLKGDPDSILTTTKNSFKTRIELYKLKESVELLITQGARYNEQIAFYLRSEFDRILQTSAANMEGSTLWTKSPLTAWMLKLKILLFSTPTSNTLLLVAICCCGLLGSLINRMKKRSTQILHSVPLGIASGYITFLAILGGKKVFLLNSGMLDMPFINPYAGAFLGLIAGLFTERVFKLLSVFFDKFSKSISSFTNGN